MGEKEIIKYCIKKKYFNTNHVRKILSEYRQLNDKQDFITFLGKYLNWDISQVEDVRHAVEDSSSKSTKIFGEQESIKETALVFEDVPNGKKLGPYIIVDKLGQGGMGAVYKAYHPGLEQYFALKVILAGLSDKDQLQRFIREAKVSARLKHPNIVAVHDVDEVEGQYYIVMDYIQGRDLREIIATEKLYPRRCLELVKELALALATAHKNGVVHRDIKPSNILIAEDGRRPYIMDFGLASVVAKETGITKSGQILGTPQYMSPEQAKGKSRHVDGRSDIYSLGTVLYEMLCGKPAVHGDTAMQMLYEVLYKEPIPLTKQRGRIPQDIEAITNKCLEKEPSHRYHTADELAADIDRYLRGDPVMAHPAGVIYRLNKWLKKNKLLALSLGVVVLMLMVSISFSIVSLKAKESAEKAKNEAQQAQKTLEESLKNLQVPKTHDATQTDKEEAERKEKQARAQSLIDEALLWCHEKRPIEDVEKKLKEAQNQAECYSAVYRAWGQIYYEYGTRESFQFQKQMFERSLEKLRKATELSPKDYLACFYQYLIYERMDDEANAYKYILKVVELNPQNEYGAFCKGIKIENELDKDKTLDFQEKIGFKEKIIAVYSESISYNPNFLYPYLSRGSIYYITKQNKKALQDFNKAIQLDPYFAPAYFMRGDIYRDMKQHKEALKDYTAGISLLPNYASFYDFRGDLYMEMNRNEEALQDFNKAIQLNPYSVPFYNSRGKLYASMNRNEEALQDFNKAIQLNPYFVLTYHHRGQLYASMNQNEEALQDFNKAIRLAPPNYVPGYMERGRFYASMNRNEEALQDFNKAIHFEPRLWQAYANRGTIYYIKGQYIEAISDFEYCRKLGIIDQRIDHYLDLCRQALKQH